MFFTLLTHIFLKHIDRKIINIRDRKIAFRWTQSKTAWDLFKRTKVPQWREVNLSNIDAGHPSAFHKAGVTMHTCSGG